jgi:hypothetical protein
MGLWKAITDAVYREYDRRIKRASLVTEYGAQHHGHGADHAAEAHADATNEDAAQTPDIDEETEEAEIVNVPRGTPVAVSTPSPAEPAEAAETATMTDDATLAEPEEAV